MNSIIRITTFLREGLKFQQRRMKAFARTFDVKADTHILDVGGYHQYWYHLDQMPQVTLLNIYPPGDDVPPHFDTTQQNACAMTYPDRAFEIAFSNSVIEHVGGPREQAAFASEVRRVGNGYYVQAPYRWALIEPHFIAPFLHWLPRPIYRKLARWLSVRGWAARPSQQEIDEMIDEIRLPTYREFQAYFPDAKIHREKFLGTTKSLIAVRLPSPERA